MEKLAKLIIVFSFVLSFLFSLLLAAGLVAWVVWIFRAVF